MNLEAGRLVVPPVELELATHPLGQGHFHWERERAAQAYPEQTRKLLEVFRVWREKLRQTLPRWSVSR